MWLSERLARPTTARTDVLSLACNYHRLDETATMRQGWEVIFKSLLELRRSIEAHPYRAWAALAFLIVFFIGRR